MNVAIIITGQMRTFAACLPNLNYFVFSKFPGAYFFVSAAKDDDAKSIELLEKYAPRRVRHEVVEQPKLEEPPASLMDHAPYAVTPTRTPGISPVQGILRQLWHLSRGYRFFQTESAVATMPMFDYVVRLRPDLHFHRLEAPFASAALGVATPWWGNYGGINDRFAVMNATAAEAFFTAYDNLPKLLEQGCPLHPETIMAANLHYHRIDVSRTLDAEFAFRRRDGFEHMVVMPGEMARYAAAMVK